MFFVLHFVKACKYVFLIKPFLTFTLFVSLHAIGTLFHGFMSYTGFCVESAHFVCFIATYGWCEGKRELLKRGRS